MAPMYESEPKCPNCKGNLTYLDHYQSYYCPLCDEHFEIKAPSPDEESQKPPPPKSVVDSIMAGESQDVPQKNVVDSIMEEEPQELPQETEVETMEAGKPQDAALEVPEEPEEVDSEQILEEDEAISEEPSEPAQEQSQLMAHEIQKKKISKKKMKFKNYRYRTRMLKGSILPILFGLISFQMINSSRMQFPDYYELEPMMILAGFILGFITISSITIMNLVKAKSNPKHGYKLNMKVGFVSYIPFIAIFMGLTLFVSLSSGWKFATGFFLASIFPIIFIAAFEASSKGKFFVKEAVDDPSWGRKLIFKH